LTTTLNVQTLFDPLCTSVRLFELALPLGTLKFAGFGVPPPVTELFVIAIALPDVLLTAVIG